MTVPAFRPGLGDHPGRVIREAHGFLEWRYCPGYGAEIVTIEVEPGRRREGTGRRLVEALLRQLHRETLTVYAITRWDNGAAHDFYEAMGFRIVARLPNFYRSREEKVDGSSGFTHALMYALDL